MLTSAGGGADARFSVWPGVGAAALLAVSVGLVAAGRIRPGAWTYHLVWYATLLALDAAWARGGNRTPLLGHPRFAVSLWLWSVPVWLLFEALNFRVANWYYVLAPPDPLARRANAVLAFATVLPAIYLGHRWLDRAGWFAGVRGRGFRLTAGWARAVSAAGVVFLSLALWKPSAFFPLIWGGTTLLLEPWNWRRCPERSLLADLASGTYTRPLRLLAAGLGIGFLWEFYNALAPTRWIYTVPGLERLRLFEMPVLGYLGFPVFALDCFVLYQALVNLGVAVPGWDGTSVHPPGTRRRRTRTAIAGLVAAAFSLVVLAGIDRYTVDSYASGPAGFPGITPRVVDALVSAGYRDLEELAEADPDEVVRRTGLPATDARRLSSLADLARLRGLGSANAAALVAAGIEGVCELAGATPGEASRAIRKRRTGPRAGHPARVRGWIRAAREACGASEPARETPVHGGRRASR